MDGRMDRAEFMGPSSWARGPKIDPPNHSEEHFLILPSFFALEYIWICKMLKTLK